MKRRIILFGLLIIYVLLINSPVIIAWLSNLPPRPFRDDFASALGMIGLAMILLEFVFSGRFKSISSPVGIDIIMRSHQVLGRVVILLLFLHPMLYSLPTNRTLPWDSYFTLTTRLDSTDTITGMLAWIGIALVVFMAVMRDALQTRYEQWRRSHLILSVITVVLALIHAMGAGRYTDFAAVDMVWAALALLALVALIHVYLVLPMQQKRHAYIIDSITVVANNCWRLVLKPQDGRVLQYLAGQFAWLKFSGPFFSLQEHPFSISSSPANRKSLEFTIKGFGDFSSRLDSLDIGSSVYVDGPHGHFNLHNRASNGLMLIAGGIGIAPIISILRQLADEHYENPVMLITCNNTPSDLAYRSELNELSSRLNIQSIHLASSGGEDSTCLKGRLSYQLLADNMPDDPEAWLYFVCGPAGMMDTAEHSLLHLGAPLKQIVTERFVYDARSLSRRSRYILYTIMGIVSITILTILGFSLHLFK